MSKISKILVACVDIIFIISLAGCATTPLTIEEREPVLRSKTFKVGFDDTWNAVIKAVSYLGEPITVAQKDSKLVTFQRTLKTIEAKNYVKIPKGVVGVGGKGKAVVNIVVTPLNAQTNVTITVKLMAYEMNLWGGTWGERIFASNGKLENEYFDKIEAILDNKNL